MIDAGYAKTHRGLITTRKSLIEQFGLEIFCDYVYFLFAENMDEEERDKFDAQLEKTCLEEEERLELAAQEAKADREARRALAGMAGRVVKAK